MASTISRARSTVRIALWRRTAIRCVFFAHLEHWHEDAVVLGANEVSREGREGERERVYVNIITISAYRMMMIAFNRMFVVSYSPSAHHGAVVLAHGLVQFHSGPLAGGERTRT